jgi:O-antigen/teichoic acid export membrane protein
MKRGSRSPGRPLQALRREHRIVAGVVDAGLSSIATFIVGLYATRTLDPAALGGYALGFSVFIVSAYVPAQLVFTPTEIAAVDYPAGRQLPLLRQSLVRGCVVSLAAAVATSAWFLIAPSGIPGEDLVALVLTCAAATFVSPVQDHVRRMLHLAGASWRAVFVAILQVLAVLLGILALRDARVDEAAVPFGALAIANVMSLAGGLVLSARQLGRGVAALGGRAVLRSGRPLLVVGLAPSLSTFVVAWLVGTIAGSPTLGYIEAARIASQPVAVLQTGLGSVLGPRATRASSRRDPAARRQVSRIFAGCVVAAGLGWVLAVGIPAPWNLLPGVIPAAYVVSGLVAASIISFTIQSLALGRRFEVYGAGGERLAARVELEGNAGRITVALGAGLMGAFVAPVGNALLGLWRLIRYRGALMDHYVPRDPGPGDRAGSGDPDALDPHEPLGPGPGARTAARP